MAVTVEPLLTITIVLILLTLPCDPLTAVEPATVFELTSTLEFIFSPFEQTHNKYPFFGQTNPTDTFVPFDKSGAIFDI